MTRKPLGAVRFATLATINAAVLTVVAVSVAADPGDIVPGREDCFNNNCRGTIRCLSCCRRECDDNGDTACAECCAQTTGGDEPCRLLNFFVN